MPNLKELVGSLLDRPGVEAVVLLSGDGLPIEHAVRNSLDPDAAAALTATLMRDVARLGEAVGRGPTAMAVLEYERGLVILARLAEGDWLMVLTEPDVDAGELLYDLRRHRPVLAALL